MLKRYSIYTFIAVVFMLFFSAFVYPEEATLDLSISLGVSSTFQITLDSGSVKFGSIQPGQWKQLGGGGYYNKITCQSNNGRTWYLKINTLSPLTSGANTITTASLKWMAGWTDGNGVVQNQYQFNDFSVTPALIYTSGADDNTGNPISIQFQYGLRVPETAKAGNYNTSIVYTMFETF